MPSPIELEFTDEQLANYPGYSWPLKCCWCGSGLGAQVRVPEVDGSTFICQICKKQNAVQRRGNKVTISPPKVSPWGCLIMLVLLVAVLGWLLRSKLPSFQLPSWHLPSVALPGAASFVTRITTWVGYAAAVLTVIHLPIQIQRWLAVRRLYGGIPLSLVWQVGIYSRKNRMLRIQLGLLVAMFLFLLPALLNWVLGDAAGYLRPSDESAARALRLPVLLIFIWQLNRVIGYLLPPTGLLLGTAKSANVHLVAVLNRELDPHRVVSLLDLKERIFPLFAPTVMYNNFRTRNGHEWRTVVHHLMDVVPVIIVDTAVRTEYVDAELHRIERFGYGYKVISFSSAAYGNEINALESGIGPVVEAAQKLGAELEPKLRSYLSKPTDIARRRKSQLDYNAMVGSVPRLARFNSDINAMLIKAHFILAWTIEKFLKDCKQPISGGESVWLLEDIPSRVTLAEEATHLRQSRGLDEVRGIAFSALDLALETPGPQQNFNVANAHTKIGKCARFSRDWDAALTHLGKAIEMLTESAKGRDVTADDLRRIQQELADAHFLRGEVHMARFRQTAATADRQNAESDFRASLSLDQQLRQDSLLAANRLRSLHPGTG